MGGGQRKNNEPISFGQKGVALRGGGRIKEETFPCCEASSGGQEMNGQRGCHVRWESPGLTPGTGRYIPHSTSYPLVHGGKQRSKEVETNLGKKTTAKACTGDFSI